MTYPVDMSVRPDVTAFFDSDTNTISYVVKDPGSNACAVIDPVLDLDYAAGRIVEVEHRIDHRASVRAGILHHVADGVGVGIEKGRHVRTDRHVHGIGHDVAPGLRLCFARACMARLSANTGRSLCRRERRPVSGICWSCALRAQGHSQLFLQVLMPRSA